MTDDKLITRTYTVPLRRGFTETPRYKRTNKAVRVLKKFLMQHMKSNTIKLGSQLNELLWAKGIKNPPPRVKITASKDTEGIVRAELEGVAYKDFKQQEKKEEPKGLKEKIQSKVKGTKKDEEPTGVNNNVAKKETSKVNAPKSSTTKETPVKQKSDVAEIKEKPKTATKETPSTNTTTAQETATKQKEETTADKEIVEKKEVTPKEN